MAMQAVATCMQVPSSLMQRQRRRPLRSVRAEVKESTTTTQNEEEGTSTSNPTTISPPQGFKAPQPRRFYVRGDQWGSILSSSLALPLRLGTGAFALGYKASWVPESDVPPNQYTSFQVAGRKLVESSNTGPRPQKPIEIYEFESCPFCRKVREMATILDIDVLYYPCPRNGPTYRPKVIQMGGKPQFPYMVDPNTGTSMYESDEIINYLAKNYGDGSVPLMLSLGLFTALTAGLAMIARLGKGSIYTPAKRPEKPLDIWAYEASPFCKIVKEVLVELELPHVYHSTPRGSANRQKLYEKVGHFQIGDMKEMHELFIFILFTQKHKLESRAQCMIVEQVKYLHLVIRWRNAEL